MADGSDRLRRALAALPEEERLATQERLAVRKRRAPGTDERQTPHRWRGRLAAALARPRETANEDGNPNCPECLWSSHRHAGGGRAVMATAARALTYDDLCRAREDGNRYELIEGELVLVAAPSPLYQRLLVWLTVRFVRLVEGEGLGEVYVAPINVRLADGSFVQPDLLVVLTDRTQIVGRALIEGEPSLVVEVASRSSRARDRQQKAALYARVGVPEYWLADLDDASITVQANPRDGRYRTLRRETGIVHAESVPGLTVDLGEFFAREHARS